MTASENAVDWDDIKRRIEAQKRERVEAELRDSKRQEAERRERREREEAELAERRARRERGDDPEPVPPPSPPPPAPPEPIQPPATEPDPAQPTPVPVQPTKRQPTYLRRAAATDISRDRRIRWALERCGRDLTPTEARVMGNLFGRLGRNSEVWSTQERLSSDLGQSVDVIKAALDGLQERGFISINRWARGRMSDYTIHLDVLEKWAEKWWRPRR